MNLGIDVKIERSTVRGQAQAVLRTAIAKGRWLPGQRVSERELCDALEISRTSLREAIRTLEGERLIVIQPNKGIRIARLTIKEALEIYDARELIESRVARLAAERITARQCEQLEAAMAAFSTAVAERRSDDMVKTASEFFGIVYEASGNTLLQELHGVLVGRVSYLRTMSMARAERAPKSEAEMLAILDALKRRDPDATCAATVAHVRAACDAALESLRMFENPEGNV